MSGSSTFERWMNSLSFLVIALSVLLGAFASTTVLIGGWITGLPFNLWVGRLLDALFALNTANTAWMITRAAGLTAYVLLWLSTAWGLAVSNKILDGLLHRAFTYDFHEFLSLLAIGFALLHIVVLMVDKYLPFSLTEILVPFIAPYRPLWVGVGVIGLYLTILVTVTFYIRRWIGPQTFRIIHYASYTAFIAVALHGLLSGTDSPLLTVQVMYAGTTLVIVFLTAYRAFIALLRVYPKTPAG